MAFRFALAAVLQYREALEQREYLALEKIQLEIAQAERRVQKLEESWSAAAKRREEELGRGTRSIHLQAAYNQELFFQKQRDDLLLKLQDLQAKRQQAMKAYELARQKREVLQELRTRAFDAYRHEQAKREQRTLDDLFLARHRRSH
jgi:flagellar protein FliJ